MTFALRATVSKSPVSDISKEPSESNVIRTWKVLSDNVVCDYVGIRIQACIALIVEIINDDINSLALVRQLQRQQQRCAVIELWNINQGHCTNKWQLRESVPFRCSSASDHSNQTRRWG